MKTVFTNVYTPKIWPQNMLRGILTELKGVTDKSTIISHELIVTCHHVEIFCILTDKDQDKHRRH